MKLYDNLDSGNGYKVRLLLARLGIPYERIEVDIDRGETRTADFLALNPNGKVPALLTDEGNVLAESNAILWYLAEGTPHLPGSRWHRAQVLQWMFFEQYSHEPCVAVARYIMRHLPPGHPRYDELPGLRARGDAALQVMEQHLTAHDFLVAEACTIADLALYAYTHVAGEGGLAIAPYPAVGAWLGRVAGEPGHVPITAG